MIDAPLTLKTFLDNASAVSSLVSTRLWAERSTPPKGYQPSDGQGLAFKSRGGIVDYSSNILTSSWQFKCYGATELEANALYRACYDALQDAYTGGLRSARLEVAGQTLEEPTGWPYVLAFFETQMNV